MLNQTSSQIKIILPLCMVIFIDALAMTLIYPLFAPLFSLDTAHGGLIIGNLSLAAKDFLYGITMAVYPLAMFFTAPLLGDFRIRLVGRRFCCCVY